MGGWGTAGSGEVPRLRAPPSVSNHHALQTEATKRTLTCPVLPPLPLWRQPPSPSCHGHAPWSPPSSSLRPLVSCSRTLDPSARTFGPPSPEGTGWHLALSSQVWPGTWAALGQVGSQRLAAQRSPRWEGAVPEDQAVAWHCAPSWLHAGAQPDSESPSTSQEPFSLGAQAAFGPHDTQLPAVCPAGPQDPLFAIL